MLMILQISFFFLKTFSHFSFAFNERIETNWKTYQIKYRLDTIRYIQVENNVGKHQQRVLLREKVFADIINILIYKKKKTRHFFFTHFIYYIFLFSDRVFARIIYRDICVRCCSTYNLFLVGIRLNLTLSFVIKNRIRAYLHKLYVL